MADFKFTDKSLSRLASCEKPYERFDNGAPAYRVSGLLIRVQPSGQKYFYLVYRNKEGRRRRTKVGEFPTLNVAEARRLARELAAEAIKGTDHVQAKRERAKARIRAKASTIGGFLDRVYEPHLMGDRSRVPGRAEERVKRIRSSFASILNKPLAELSALDIERWQRSDAAHKCLETIGRDLNDLQGLLSFAVARDVIDKHPLQLSERRKTKLKRPRSARKIRNSRVRYLNQHEPAEEKRLRDALAARDRKQIEGRISGNAHRQARGKPELPNLFGPYGDYLTPLVLLALNTGGRPKELLSLRWSSVDLARAILTFEHETTKDRETRHIPLNEEAVSVLKQWQAVAGSDGLVFEINGDPIQTPKRAFRAVCKEAQLADFRFYDCRHDFASKLVMGGVDLYTVSQLLGHSDVTMTQRYAHLAPAHLARSVAVLNQ